MAAVGLPVIVPATMLQRGLGCHIAESSSCGCQLDSVCVLRASDLTGLFKRKECSPLWSSVTWNATTGNINTLAHWHIHTQTLHIKKDQMSDVPVCWIVSRESKHVFFSSPNHLCKSWHLYFEQTSYGKVLSPLLLCFIRDAFLFVSLGAVVEQN